MIARRALSLLKNNFTKQNLYAFSQQATQVEYKQYDLKDQQIQLYPQIVPQALQNVTESEVIVPKVIIYNDPFQDMVYEMRNKRHEVAKKKRRKRKFGSKTKPRYK